MKLIVSTVFSFMSVLLASAQFNMSDSAIAADKGIKFEQGLTWTQVKEKAKRENKYIFLDCYTTWCGPCKEMEKSVYPMEKVGASLNGKFISLKVQMDTSKKDDEFIKSWYPDAHAIFSRYKLEGYPSYLFFTPDGKIINRGIGAKSPEDFIKMTADVIDPSKDYYKLLANFQEGKRNPREMSVLARTGLLLGDTANSQKVAKEYISSVQNTSSFTKDDIEFCSEFTTKSGDKGFKLFYQHSIRIDSIMNDDIYAEQLIQRILYKEIVGPELENSKKTPGSVPNWDILKNTIEKKYNKYYAGRVITAARSSWGLNHKDLPEYTKYLVLYQDQYGAKTSHGLMASLVLNNYAWAIFENSNKPEELEKALNWSSRAIMIYPMAEWMDTYANILYKLGRNTESIMWEEIATKLSPTEKGFQETLEKMKRGQATWSMK